MQADGVNGQPSLPPTETPVPSAPSSSVAPQQAAVPRRPSRRMTATSKPDNGLLSAAAALAGDTRVVLVALAGWTLASRILKGRRRRAAPVSPETAAIEGEMARLRASLALLRDDNDELAAQVAQLRTGLAKARREGVPKALLDAFDEAAAVGSGTAAGHSLVLPAPAAPAPNGVETPLSDGDGPETPVGHGAVASGPLADVLAALEQLKLENQELRGAMAQLRAENAELAERMVEVAFTGAGEVDVPEEAARGGPSPLGAWAGGAGETSVGGSHAGEPAGVPASQERLHGASTMYKELRGAISSGAEGPSTPGIPSESILGRDSSNAIELPRFIKAAVYLED